MKIAKNIRYFFSFNLEDRYDWILSNRIIILSIVLTLLTTISAFFTVYSFITRNYFWAINSACLCLITAATLIIVKKKKKADLGSKIVVVALSYVSIIVVVTGGAGGAGLYWLFIYPLAAIYLLGLKTGRVLTLILIVFTLLMFSLPEQLFFNYDLEVFSFDQKIRFISSFLVVFTITYMMELLRNKLIQRLEKSMLDSQKAITEKSEFISKLSHQIRTPLNNIFVIFDIIDKKSLDADQRDFIDTIYASAHNLVNVVNEIDEVSKLPVDSQSIDNLRFDLYVTINNLISLFKSKGSQVTFNLNFDQKIPDNLIGSPVKIKQIFLNLIEVIINNSLVLNDLVIDVNVMEQKSDSDNIDCLFEIRANNFEMIGLKESLEKGGEEQYLSELDLNLTKKIIESFGGKLKIKSINKFTEYSFNIRFKKTNDLHIEHQQVIVEDHGEVVAKSNGVELNDAKVLLVEDNQINQKIVILSLNKLVNEIDIANNGKEALDKFGIKKYDLILMDVQMPIMDGLLTTRKIRETESTTNSHIPIIAMTANALLGDKESCFAAGMDDYIAKPFKLEVLLDKIKLHLSAAN